MDVASVETKPMMETMKVVYVFRKLDQLRALPGWVSQLRRRAKSVEGVERMTCVVLDIVRDVGDGDGKGEEVW
jgi:hypothetical protein